MISYGSFISNFQQNLHCCNCKYSYFHQEGWGRVDRERISQKDTHILFLSRALSNYSAIRVIIPQSLPHVPHSTDITQHLAGQLMRFHDKNNFFYEEITLKKVIKCQQKCYYTANIFGVRITALYHVSLLSCSIFIPNYKIYIVDSIAKESTETDLI